MKIFALLIALGIQVNNLELSHLFGKKWIIESEATGFPRNINDTVHFIPDSSPKAENISMHYRYNEIEFFTDNNIRQYHWKKCGNDGSPGFTDGTWKFNKSTQTISIIGLNNWEGEYRILQLSNDNLKLIKIK